MAIDGLVLDVADTPDNDKAFGRSGTDQTPGPFPHVRLVALGDAARRRAEPVRGCRGVEASSR